MEIDQHLQFRLIYENSLDGILLTIPDGTVLAANPAACRILGRTEEEICRLGREGLVDTTDPRLPVLLEERARTGRCMGELTLIKGDGTRLPCEVSSRVFTDETGAQRTSMIIRDVSERKRMEAALRESEELHRDLVEHSQALICTHDLEGRLLSVNSWAVKVTGYPLNTLLGMNMQDLLIPELRDRFDEYLDEVRNHGAAQGLMTIQTATGERRIWEYHNTLRTAGLAVPVVRGIAHDITDHKRSEDALRKSEERLQMALWAADLGMWDRNVVTGELSMNAHLAEILGYLPSEIESGIPFWESLIHPEELPRVTDAFNAHIEGKTESYEAEYRMRTKTGQWKWILDKGKVTKRNPDGRPLRAVGTYLDVTSRRKIEEERLQFERRIFQIQKAESLDRMAGAIAHHFNNLLGMIMGNLELALLDLHNDVSMTERSMLGAQQAARRAAELSSLMLTFVGQVPGGIAREDLSRICKDLLPLIHASIPKKVRIETDLSEPVMVDADTAHIRQMLLNLATNAWEAVEENEGVVHIKVCAVDASEVGPYRLFPVDYKLDAERYACLEVSDSGCGMTAETMDRLFDPFFSTKFTGRGLGLAATLGLARLYGGAVAVSSTSGGGSVFRVLLPISLDESLPVGSEDATDFPDIPHFDGGTILLAEDQEALRNVTRSMLERMGFKVLTAIDGRQAVDEFREHKEEIVCVLSDLTMPRLNGWEAMAEIWAIRPDVPVILTSGYDEAQVLRGRQQRSPEAFLKKPYDLKGLMESLKKALGRVSDRSAVM